MNLKSWFQRPMNFNAAKIMVVIQKCNLDDLIDTFSKFRNYTGRISHSALFELMLVIFIHS